ncbi:MAG: acetylxylan esterase [Bacteroidales bacterium]|nr:acetylxylan esterase [Bacteroidales bacterium]
MKRLILSFLSLIFVLGQAMAQVQFSDYFEKSKGEPLATQDDGFIRRWLVLEPISKPNRGNTVFTDSYIRTEFAKDYFKDQMTVMPFDGKKEKANVVLEVKGKNAQPQRGWNMTPPVLKDAKQTLAWHKLDSKLYNFKLYRFATTLQKQNYGIMFFVVTTIICDEELKDVRLSVGSNSASMWWVNGSEALILSGDRRMVADDGASHRLTLQKGENVIRGIIINGPGMSDFCVRLKDDNGNVVTNFKTK